jgi:proteasome assembly chaperone (PAC2) family protein
VERRGGRRPQPPLQFIARPSARPRFARIDPEEFYDFQATRPQIRLVDGKSREIEWPEVEVYAARVPRAPRDLILLQGPEPSMRWRTFMQQIVDLSDALGVQMVVTLGALLADVPHTRPGAHHRLRLRRGARRAPRAAELELRGADRHHGAVLSACQAAGMPCASLWASVPHYVAAAPNPKAALALVRKLEGLVGVSVDAQELESDAGRYETQVSAAVAQDPDVQAFVERLEAAALEEEAAGTPDVPSGDVIARDFQRFLRQRGPGES